MPVKTILPTSHWQNNCRFILLRENMKLLYIIICRKKQAQSISQLADILFIVKKMAVVQPEKGKRAVTHYRVLSHLNHKFNYIECQLETGRTHQIRVHMASIMHPLLGDELYGPKPQKCLKTLQGTDTACKNFRISTSGYQSIY